MASRLIAVIVLVACVYLANAENNGVATVKSNLPPLAPSLTTKYSSEEVIERKLTYYGNDTAPTKFDSTGGVVPCLAGVAGACDNAVTACIAGRHFLSLFCNCMDYYSRLYQCLIDKFCGHD